MWRVTAGHGEGAPPELHYLWHDGETEAQTLPRSAQGPHWPQVDRPHVAGLFLLLTVLNQGVSSGPPQFTEQAHPPQDCIYPAPWSQDAKCHLLPNL